MAELPDTVVKCDGCGENLNLLASYLAISIKAQRNVLLLVSENSADPDVVPDDEIRLGSKKGRGRMMKMHGFDCLAEYAKKRKGKKAKLEVHSEKEIYVPEDNPTEKELAKRVAAAAEESES